MSVNPWKPALGREDVVAWVEWVEKGRWHEKEVPVLL